MLNVNLATTFPGLVSLTTTSEFSPQESVIAKLQGGEETHNLLIRGARGSDRTDIGQVSQKRLNPQVTQIFHPLFRNRSPQAIEGLLHRMHNQFLAETEVGLIKSTCISEEGKKEIRKMIGLARHREVPISDVADTIWRHLAIDFAGKLKGAKYDFANCIEEGKDSAANVVEIVIPRPSFEKFYEKFHFGFDRSAQILGRPFNMDFFEVHRENGTNYGVFWLPSPGAYFDIFNTYYPGITARMQFISGSYQANLANSFHLWGIHLIALPLDPIYLGDVEVTVPPFIFAFHDLYHFIHFAMTPVAVRKRRAMIYAALDETERFLKNERPLPFDTKEIKYFLIDGNDDRDDLVFTGKTNEEILAKQVIKLLNDIIEGIKKGATTKKDFSQKLGVFDRFLQTFLKLLPTNLRGSAAPDWVYEQIRQLAERIGEKLAA